MACHPIRLVILLGAVAAVAVSPARAADAPKATCPTVRTVKVTECVCEPYQVKRTAYRWECRQEVCDSFRCETVCEQRDRVCTVQVPVMKTEMRKVCCNVVTCEERVTMKNCYEYRQVTTMVKKCVSKGHYECCEVCKEPGFFEKLCNPCACPRTVTKKKWVCCPVYTECPVTKCCKVCVPKPVVCKVRVCKTVVKEVPVQVCTYRCEQRVEKCNVMVTRKVPCKVTHTVRACVPYEETVTCYRMVPRTVERQVVECCPAPCCQTCCCPTTCCDTCCNTCCKPSRFRCAGLRFRNTCCDNCCDCCH